MKRWKIGALLCTVVICLSMGLAGCQQSEYTPSGKSQSVPSSALGKPGTLRVGVNASSAPLAGQTSSSSRIVGIDVDVAAYLADQLGTKVEVIDVGNDPVSALDEGNVDVVLGVDASDSEADYWRSDSYISTGVALFGSQSESTVPETGSNPKIAAQASSKSSWRVTNLFGDDALVSETDLKSAFEALAKGDARYVAADAVIGTYVSYSNDYSDKIVALMQDSSGYCAAVADSNKELQTAISTAMNKLINGGMMDVIEKKWLGTSIDLDSVKVIKSNSDSSSSSSSASASAASPDPAEGGEAPAEETPAEEAPAEEPAPAEEAPAEEPAPAEA